MRTLPQPKIKLLNLRLSKTTGNIKAFADIDFQGLTIRDVKVIHQNSQRPYVRLPEAAFIGNDGKKHYKHILEVNDPELKKDLSKVVLFAYYKELIKERGKKETP
ncbi:septation protein SpoVG family protein [Persephonella sp.]|uniref:septation protein SpoVG family protein n=1 Tax=Persephonella sp. TaxID=2060922 RepID=UPI0025D5786A|nr:septation protein SpoVG family protein [Persephonella sp.]